MLTVLRQSVTVTRRVKLKTRHQIQVKLIKHRFAHSSACQGGEEHQLHHNSRAVGQRQNKIDLLLPRFKTMESQYQKAIETLNNELQTNFAVLEQVKKERREQAHLRLDKTLTYLEQSGMSVSDLDSLGVIHVTGTKGKGSTCAFCESLLRQRAGLKTGLFTSPHLLSVTERIRIDGEPIDKNLFAHYFWQVYDRIVAANPGQPLPNYFQFLTVLAFNIFWREGVDVAIMEVGVGGRYDSTNIVRSPVVCGITTLDIDHTSILGKTIEEIAWQKAGIMKHGVPTLIDGRQTKGALEVLAVEAAKVGSRLEEVPSLEAYDWGPFPPYALGPGGLQGQQAVYQRNASLALQLSRRFCEERFPAGKSNPGGDSASVARPFRLNVREALGLRLCKWPGRAQVIRKKEDLTTQQGHSKRPLIYFLDGAHTKLSMESCVSWFSSASASEAARAGLVTGGVGGTPSSSSPSSSNIIYKALIFNLTKDDRQARPLLQLLSAGLNWDLVVFTPNLVRSVNVDNVNNCVNAEQQLTRCKNMVSAWGEISPGSSAVVMSVDNVNDAVEAVKARATSVSEVGQAQVLVTGSLLLLGNLLQVVEPNLAFKPSPEEEARLVKLYERLDGTVL